MGYDFSKEAEATNKALEKHIDKLGVLSEEQIKEVLPAQSDQKELKELIDAVNDAADENAKKAVLLERLGTLSEAVKKAALIAIKVAI